MFTNLLEKMGNRPILKERICFIIVYFGEFPVWFPAFLQSCKYNPQINWKIWSDATNSPTDLPQNVSISQIDFAEFKSNAANVVDTEITFTNAHKLCDMKPMYGDLFHQNLREFDYWGHCDLDLIWGDIESFLARINYQNFDVISTRKLTICGHFTIYRNNESLNKLYQQVPGYRKIFNEPDYSGFDEGYFSYHLYSQIQNISSSIKVYWPKKYAVDWPELEYSPLGWFWKNGKIYGRNNSERIYLHFMKWKKSLREIDFQYIDDPSEFKITRYGIWKGKVDVRYTLEYFSMRLLGKKLNRYWKRIIGSFNKRVLKKSIVQNPEIPEGYKIID